ncbi:MAG: hypothetical protein ACRDSL_00580 [Pseudonocardiaceae bacterium]
MSTAADAIAAAFGPHVPWAMAISGLIIVLVTLARRDTLGLDSVIKAIAKAIEELTTTACERRKERTAYRRRQGFLEQATWFKSHNLTPQDLEAVKQLDPSFSTAGGAPPPEHPPTPPSTTQVVPITGHTARKRAR